MLDLTAGWVKPEIRTRLDEASGRVAATRARPPARAPATRPRASTAKRKT